MSSPGSSAGAVGGTRRWCRLEERVRSRRPTPIDEYVAALDEPKRTTLTSLRDTIMAIVPDAEQCISHGGDVYGRGLGIIGPAASGLTPSPELSASTQECLLRWILRARRQVGR